MYFCVFWFSLNDLYTHKTKKIPMEEDDSNPASAPQKFLVQGATTRLMALVALVTLCFFSWDRSDIVVDSQHRYFTFSFN